MATIRIQQAKCPECAAPLEVAREATQIRCAFCRSTFVVEHKRAPRSAPPAARTVYVAPPTPLPVRLAAWIGPLVPFVVLGTIFGPNLLMRVRSATGRFPIECPLNGHVSLSGKRFSGAGTLVRAELNCEVVIRDCQLSGDTIVEGGGNLSLVIEGSTLVARERAVEAGGNARVRIGGQSRVEGARAALDLGGNAEVRLRASRLASAGVAVRAGGNLVIDAVDGEISGGEAAIESASRPERIDLAHTKVTGAQRVARRR